MNSLRLALTVSAVTVLLAGCGSDNNRNTNNSGSPEPAAAPETLGESLERLGVDTTDSPRLDDNGDAFPDTYSPLGTTVSMREIFVEDPDAAGPVSEFIIGRAEELLLAGFRTADTADGVISIVDDFSIAPTDNATGRLVDPALLFEEVSANAAWTLEERDDTLSKWVVQGTRRSATAADVNGNGYLESVLIYLDVAGGPENLRLLVTDAASPVPTTADIAIPVDSQIFPAV